MRCALGSTIAWAKAEMEAAANAAQEEARKKSEERRMKAAKKPADIALSRFLGRPHLNRRSAQALSE
jgi:hypothetical protein